MSSRTSLLLTALGIVTRSASADWVPTSEGAVDDSLADELIVELAPEVRLHPDDWARPANVDWYLGKTSLRFSHAHCSDHEVLAAGNVTQANLSEQKHAPTDFFCGHTTALESSGDAHGEFFLHSDASVRAGMSDSSGWRMYAHVKKSVVVTGGLDVQFWFFYAYDFAKYGLNHEADWEHITVSTDARGRFVSAWYAQHTYGARFQKSDLEWSGTHPVVYSALGTHASYPRAGSWPTHYPTLTDRTADGGPVWKGWDTVVDVGDEDHPRNGQTFIRFGGLWGGEGLLSGRIPTGTAAPTTPSFQAAWTKY